MAVPSALHLALDLARNPVLASMARRQRLPKDILVLLRVAAGDASALHSASLVTGKDAATVRSAAILYLQQVLWQPGTDHYRALGADGDASRATLLEHVRWLMKWLHPDQQHSAEETAFVERVVAAWNELKTPERRAAYDKTLPALQKPNRASRKHGRRIPLIAETGEANPRHVMVLRVAALAVAVIALVGVIVVDWPSLLAPRLPTGAAPAAPAPAAVDSAPSLPAVTTATVSPDN